ncbi:hypothetical protein L6164_028410 [Bauhinia variegata]|uniref:Uncharacterized protein n=1 Tax=Bauhinia variegata TaxID=167791 RepID=A0ACB9L638_BAUVA|nr:hypothetical protein L6164_028410 [Bauhinia variegata]
MATNNHHDEEHMAFKKIAIPRIQNAVSSIRTRAVEANNFEIKLAVIQMVQNNQFTGEPNEEPNLHLSTFLEICDTFKYNEERFKELLRKCPHLGKQDWLVMQAFYGRLGSHTKTIIDVAARGAFLDKDYAEAYELLEEVTTNASDWNVR